MTDLNYYQILGVRRNATQEEIKKAFRLYASKFHPDKHKGDSFFSNQFKLAKEAYDILSDPKKRRQYDQSYFGEVTKESNFHTSKYGRNKKSTKHQPPPKSKKYDSKSQRSHDVFSDGNWNLGWKFYLGIAIAIYLFFELFFPKADDFIIGWSEEEITAYMRSCRGAAISLRDEHGLDDYEINIYCVCTHREILSLYPDGPSRLQNLNRENVQDIMSICLDEALSTRN